MKQKEERIKKKKLVKSVKIKLMALCISLSQYISYRRSVASDLTDLSKFFGPAALFYFILTFLVGSSVSLSSVIFTAACQ